MNSRVNVQIKICRDCGKEVHMLVDNDDMLIHYEKMCPCLEKIMEKRRNRPIKNPGNIFHAQRKLEL